MEIWEGWQKVNGEKIDDLEEYITNQIKERQVSSINKNHDLDILIGTDAMLKSVGKKAKVVSFMTVIVFKKGNNGCHVIKRRENEVAKGFIPTAVKLNGEINKTAALSFWFRDHIDLEPHIHMDINPNPSYGSHEVYKYIHGYFESCGFKNVEYKPNGCVASICADYFL